MMDMGFQLTKRNIFEEEEFVIEIDGRAIDEIELIGEAIESLIAQFKEKDFINTDEPERFRQEMKRIISAVAENYRSLGMNESFIQDCNSLISNGKMGNKTNG